MSFNSMSFLWIFLPIFLVIYFLIDKKYKKICLVITSLFFYSWGQFEYLVLLIISIIANYYFGILMNKKNKKIILVISLLFNLIILGYYKYFNFIITNINHLFNQNISLLNISLPIGLSFYTFSNISYIIDVYRKDVKSQKKIIDYALYVSFFPKLLMGPIEKYKDFYKKLCNPKITIDSFYDGIISFGYGLFKKAVISNTLAITVNAIFNYEVSYLTFGIAWLGTICYTLQIYFDFSGYSDMAVGIGKMLGIELSNNFNFPYMANSITDFWRKWHITLNKWFISYIYIPLGGSRKGLKRTIINIAIIFILTGLWHGSAWNFVFWGCFHGFFVIIERMGLEKILNKFKLLNHIYTILIVSISWVFFRSPGLKYAFKYIKQMFAINYVSKLNKLDLYEVMSYKTILIVLIAILFSGIVQTLCIKNKFFIKMKTFYKDNFEYIFVIVLIIISIFSIISGTYNSFIYAQF